MNNSVRRLKVSLALLTLVVVTPVVSWSQLLSSNDITLASSTDASSNAPPYISFSGKVPDALTTGQANIVGARFSLYQDQQGGAPLWQEVQSLHTDAEGRYSVVLGEEHAQGIPADMFAASGAKWLGISYEDQPEQSRILLVSVPYAMKAADSDTLGGLSASDFVQIQQLLPLLRGQFTLQSPRQSASIAAVAAPGLQVAGTAASPLPATTFSDNTSSEVLLVSQLGTGYAVHGTSNGNAALAGMNYSTASGAMAIYGATFSPNGVGARAESLAPMGSGIGMWGVSGNNGTGVLGESTAASGAAYGVRGKTYGTSGIAVYGNSLSMTGVTTGVRGENHSPTGSAGVFDTVQGGNILSGTTSGSQEFVVDSAGNVMTAGQVTGSSFSGSGAGLTNVNATTLDGLPASAFLTSNNSNLVGTSVFAGTTGGANGQGGLIQDNLDTVHSVTGQSGSNYHFRLSRGTTDANGNRPDFLITPYDYGMAVEYPGVLEFWVQEFSVHRHPNVSPIGAQFWVGDESDSGGLWATAHAVASGANGDIILSADRFDHTSHGNFFLTTRNPTDSFVFTNGQWMQDLPIAQIHRQFDAVHDQASVESVDGNVDAGVIADNLNSQVRIGSRSAHPVALVTGDTQANVTLFPSGDVSVGNTTDSAALSVGSGGQFQVSSAGAATIGGGTPILKHMSVTGGVAFGTVTASSCVTQSLAATGASDGDTVALGIPNALGSIEGITFFGWASGPDTVSIRACNATTQDIDVASSMIRVDVWKH